MEVSPSSLRLRPECAHLSASQAMPFQSLASFVVVFALALVTPLAARAVCAEPESCVCQRLPTEHVLRGRLSSLDDALATVEVQEVLGQRAESAIEPGMSIVGLTDDRPLCELPDIAIAPGDEVLALWQGPEKRLVLIPWADQLDLGGGRQLPSAEAAMLANTDSCLQRYPAPPPEPCDDVIRVPLRADGCSTGGDAEPSHAAWCVLLLLWAARRKRHE